MKSQVNWTLGRSPLERSQGTTGVTILEIEGMRGSCWLVCGRMADSNRYQRAFIDFFESELVRFGYDWKKVLTEYLLKGREPLIHGLISGRELSFLVFL
jgi:hypothetical protein